MSAISFADLWMPERRPATWPWPAPRRWHYDHDQAKAQAWIYRPGGTFDRRIMGEEARSTQLDRLGCIARWGDA